MPEFDFQSVLRWIETEQEEHATEKFTPESQLARTATMFKPDDQWWFFLEQYYKRAEVLGLETPAGRQALAKLASTAVAMVASVVQAHGALPAPAFPSGEIRTWKR